MLLTAICNRDRSALKDQRNDTRYITTSTEGRSGFTAKNLHVEAKTILRVMQLTAALLLIFSLSLSAHSVSQTVSIQDESISFEKVFREIKKQTGYSVLTGQVSFDKSATIALNAKDMDLRLFMEKILREKPFDFEIKSKTIFIKKKLKTAGNLITRLVFEIPPITIRGRITNEKDEPVLASVLVKGTKNGTTTDKDGHFELTNVDGNAVLIISGINIKTSEVPVDNKNYILILATTRFANEEEVIFNGGYYKTTEKNRTGNIGKVTSKDIEKQPVTSPLMALQGRLAGVEVTPTNGIAGSATKIRIRGQNSLNIGADNNLGDGNRPLYIIDDVPIDSRPLVNVSTVLIDNGLDPLSTINPANIESIEVLKDADATAIYGSRGANGVILITTKQKTKGEASIVELNGYRGFGKVSKFVDLMNTEQYLAMRREAFYNDSVNGAFFYTPGSLNPDFDVLKWSPNRYTNWQKTLFGGTSHITDAQLYISGGNSQTSFRLGGGYHKETMVFPADLGYKRINGTLSVNHRSGNNKFKASANVTYSYDQNDVFFDADLMQRALTLAPNAPPIFDSTGQLTSELGFANPYLSFRKSHQANAYNLINSGNFSYEILPGLAIKTNIGYSDLNQSEIAKDPISSYPPQGRQYFTASLLSGDNKRRSWIAEPQLTFDKNIENHSINAVFGSTFQESRYESFAMSSTGYTSDALLDDPRVATYTFIQRNDKSKYNYAAIFGRIGYQFKAKYLLNVTGRRDGSSRFGPGNKYANFGAVGAAWIFSQENFVLNSRPFLSFGKLRVSYGSTGNDNIGDYQFYNSYIVRTARYQDVPTLTPTSLFNPDYKWEVNRKFEAAVEVNFVKNRFGFEVAWYRNRSSNQLINYTLPAVTGFPAVLSNFNATVQNTGWEIVVRSTNICTSNFRWNTSANLTIPKNKLIAFPDFENSSYNAYYAIGEPLSIQKSYLFKGVNPSTGLFEFEDYNKDGIVDEKDKQFIQHTGSTYYGGLNNSIVFKSFELSFLFQFAKKTNLKYKSGVPGNQGNIPVVYLHRWQKEGDISELQYVSQDIFGQSATKFYQYYMSNAGYEDASFIRLKTLGLSYNIPATLLQRAKIANLSLFIQGQNLWTITKYKNLDPETAQLVPPLRMVTFGLNVKF